MVPITLLSGWWLIERIDCLDWLLLWKYWGMLLVGGRKLGKTYFVDGPLLQVLLLLLLLLLLLRGRRMRHYARKFWALAALVCIEVCFIVAH